MNRVTTNYCDNLTMFEVSSTVSSPQPVMTPNAASIIDRLVMQAGQLHSLPAVAMEVLRLTENPRVDARALKECIENDPALTGKLLRVVNSSLFGLSREVSDLNQALALLGTKPLKLLVLGFSLPPGLFQGIERETLQQYWRHTLTKAVAGREISESMFRVAGDDAFIIGLLQDLGLLLLIQVVGEPYAKFLERAIADHGDLIALENRAVGFDHTALSAKLLQHWNLPRSLVEAVSWNEPDMLSLAKSPPKQSLRQILLLAELMAQVLADENPNALPWLLKVGEAHCGLSAARLEESVAILEEKVGQLADVLSLQLPGNLEYRDVLARAQVQLADVANETAGDLLGIGQRQQQEATEESLLDEVRYLSEAVAKIAAHPLLENVEENAAAAAPQEAAPAPVPAVSESPAAVTASTPLLDQLSIAVAACRKAHCPLSLLLAGFGSDSSMQDMEHRQRFQWAVQQACREVGRAQALGFPHGDSDWALILPGCDRQKAVDLGNQLVAQVEALNPDSQPDEFSLGVGVASVALPPKNFPTEELLAAADRCLYGSMSFGGGAVKSIEIY